MNVKYSKIACIILASGVGRRFGANKLLTAIDGAPMLQHILDISQGLFAKRIVVTRHKEVAEICAQQLLQTAGKAGFQLRLCRFGKYFLQDFFYFFF